MMKFTQILRVRVYVTVVCLLAVLVGICPSQAADKSSVKPAEKKTEEYSSVPVLVNVIKGTNPTPTDAQIKAIVDRVNETYKKNGVKARLKFDTNNINRDVSDGGSGSEQDDGKVTSAERLGPNGLYEKGKDELKNKFGTQKGDANQPVGMKINIANDVLSSDASTNLGVSYHADQSATETPPTPVVFVKWPPKPALPPTDPDNGTDAVGDTATHEISHAFTLGAGHKTGLPSDPNGVADAGGHSKDPNNAMYPDDTYGGTDLSGPQAREIEKGAKRQAGPKGTKTRTRTTTIDPVTEKKQVQHSISTATTYHSYFVDSFFDVGMGFNDITEGYLYADGPSGLLQLDVMLAEPLTPDVYNMVLTVLFDTDNNIATGTSYGMMNGVDKAALFEFQGGYPESFIGQPAGLVGRIMDTSTNQSLFLPSGVVNDYDELLDNFVYADQPRTELINSGLHVTIPMEMLGTLAYEVPIGVILENINIAEMDEAVGLWKMDDPTLPEFELLTTEAHPGGVVDVAGTNFLDGPTVQILIDDQVLDVLPVIAGEFSGSVILPPGTEYGPQFIYAQMDTGRYDFSILEVLHNPADIDDDREVNLLDFHEMAQSWLLVE